MQELLDFFSVLGELIYSGILFIIDLIADLIEMLLVLGLAALRLPSLLAFLPDPIVSVLVVFLTAAILYKVLGREG